MKKLPLYVALAIIAGVALAPMAVWAQPYYYVNTAGEIRVESAETPTEAIVEAPARAPHSGVMEAMDAEASVITPVDADSETYTYVDVNGGLSLQVAESAQEALVLAEDRMPNSGVMLTIR